MPKAITTSVEKRGRGRPRFQIDKKLLKKMAYAGCTLAEISEYFNVDRNYFSRPEWQVIIKKEQARLRYKIRTWQNKSASEGNGIMLTHLGKHVLGQTDDTNQQTGSTININFVGVISGEKASDINAARDSAARGQIPEFVSDQ